MYHPTLGICQPQKLKVFTCTEIRRVGSLVLSRDRFVFFFLKFFRNLKISSRILFYSLTDRDSVRIPVFKGSSVNSGQVIFRYFETYQCCESRVLELGTTIRISFLQDTKLRIVSVASFPFLRSKLDQRIFNTEWCQQDLNNCTMSAEIRVSVARDNRCSVACALF